ncbi:MAG: cyanophycinase [Gemmatimonadota bacterium]|nr:cyanophycinase [Gemmatimonadota bacterium]
MFLFCLTLVVSTNVCAQTVGPENGSLVIVGGAMRDPAIVQRFLELAGGPDSKIVVIPTAGGRDEYEADWSGLTQFRSAGATDVSVLHTTNREVADSDEFVAAIESASGLWFTGGRQWRLVDAYAGTKTEEALWRLLERGGVIGGSSAGATIQGSYLVRGDTETNTVMMGDHEVGFGFLKNVGIDQHLLRRNRHFDMLEIMEAHPELLGIGIDENTAIVVQGDEFEVIGETYVVIYDTERRIDTGGDFYFLDVGDRFNLVTREAKRGNGNVPRVVHR